MSGRSPLRELFRWNDKTGSYNICSCFWNSIPWKQLAFKHWSTYEPLRKTILITCHTLLLTPQKDRCCDWVAPLSKKHKMHSMLTGEDLQITVGVCRGYRRQQMFHAARGILNFWGFFFFFINVTLHQKKIGVYWDGGCALLFVRPDLTVKRERERERDRLTHTYTYTLT